MQNTFLSSNSTVPTTSSDIYLAPGWHQFQLVTADSSASIAVNQKSGSTELPVNNSAGAVALTSANPLQVIYSPGANFNVTRTGGSGAVTVESTPAQSFI